MRPTKRNDNSFYNVVESRKLLVFFGDALIEIDTKFYKAGSTLTGGVKKSFNSNTFFHLNPFLKEGKTPIRFWKPAKRMSFARFKCGVFETVKV
jgi:hypothetical protein